MSIEVHDLCKTFPGPEPVVAVDHVSFTVSPGHAPAGEPAEHFMVKLLRGDLPDGPIHFHEAFGGAA